MTSKKAKKKTRVTAAELLAHLAADPEFVAKEAQREGERQRREAAYRRAETPLVSELYAAGVHVDSVWDLVNMSGSYSTAIPILLDHIGRPYPPAVREGIARALAVPETRTYNGWELLTRLFREEKVPRVKDGLAAAISGAADDDVLGDVIALAHETHLGPSRLLLLSALERSADPRARRALIELAEDPDLEKEIAVILRRLDRRRQ